MALPWTDPIVDEIHAIREQMAKEAGYDLRTLVKRIHESQRREDKVVTPPPQRHEE